MTIKTQSQYGFEDYLAAERAARGAKHEYVNGEVFAMTGASFNHNLLVLNLGSELRARLKGRPCHVLPSDMRVRIEAANAATYPDLTALCEPPRFHDDRQDVLLNPALIVEVLSGSTEAYDRGGKFATYRRLPSLQEHVLVSQDQPLVEIFTRQPDARWVLSETEGLDTEVVFASLGCRVAMQEIYDKVDFEHGGREGD
ncbi:Uma2 family endonuclease [Thiocapsa bogorovii]|uniref:Uma2 family endonuclease n=1 Tax=Thiocapsa bogorovii TaxID=521689 RepID=UPI001E2B263B|nr:Uma2 family endonuclease [Thiocapsa bogorovii]UHD14405.1 Uma2 family endonuclease [Thiocapsa bogorovii]